MKKKNQKKIEPVISAESAEKEPILSEEEESSVDLDVEAPPSAGAMQTREGQDSGPNERSGDRQGHSSGRGS